MLDVVLVLVLPRRNRLPLAGGRGRVEVFHFRRRQAADLDQHEPATARARHAEAEALVLLVVQQHIVFLADDVSIDTVGTLGGIGDRVEERLVVGGPRHRRDLFDRTLEHRPGAQILHRQSIFAEAGIVGRIGEQVAVVADALRADAHVLLALRELVDVEINLFGGREAALLAAVDRILFALLGARIVVEPVLARRHGEVGLLDPPEHFLVERLLQRRERLHHRFGVGVLGLEVLHDLRTALLAQPEVLVVEAIAVQFANVRDLVCDGGPDLVGCVQRVHAGS
jgi:hypothetical protein